MSRDNGYVIRKNRKGQFILQEYSASAEEYPNVENSGLDNTFYSLLEAIMAYSKIQDECEYGLRIEIEIPQIQNYYEKDQDDRS